MSEGLSNNVQQAAPDTERERPGAAPTITLEERPIEIAQIMEKSSMERGMMKKAKEKRSEGSLHETPL